MASGTIFAPVGEWKYYNSFSTNGSCGFPTGSKEVYIRVKINGRNDLYSFVYFPSNFISSTQISMVGTGGFNMSNYPGVFVRMNISTSSISVSDIRVDGSLASSYDVEVYYR